METTTATSTATTPTTMTVTVAAAAAAFGLVYLLWQQQQQKTHHCRRRKELQDQLDSNDPILSSLLLSSSSSSSKSCIYLDYNATTPIHPLVLSAMIPFLSTHFGNPSSSHIYGKIPKQAIAKARHSLLSLLHHHHHHHNNSSNNDDSKMEDLDDENVGSPDSSSIVFTGCGTESNNMAIQLAIQSSKIFHNTNNNNNNNNHDENDENGKQKVLGHIVTSNVEHPAVIEYLKLLEAEGQIEVTFVPVNNEGIVSTQDMIHAIRPNTVLITLMLANNESGAIQPVKEVFTECRRRYHNHNILCHTDAAQAVGKISIHLKEDLGFPDMITIVGHKFGAPKGVAALYVRPNCFVSSSSEEEEEKEKDSGSQIHHEKEPPQQQQQKQQRKIRRVVPRGYGSVGSFLVGGGQEMGRRGGTENVPYIVGMGRAAELLLCSEEDNNNNNDNNNTMDQQSQSSSSSLILPTWKKNAIHMESMRQRLLHNLIESLGSDIVKPNGPIDPQKRLPNTLSVGLRNIMANELLLSIQTKVAASAGSACHSSSSLLCDDDDDGDDRRTKKNKQTNKKIKVSPVLEAMNVPIEYAMGTLRLSVGPKTTIEEIDEASMIIVNEAKKQQMMNKK